MVNYNHAEAIKELEQIKKKAAKGKYYHSEVPLRASKKDENPPRCLGITSAGLPCNMKAYTGACVEHFSSVKTSITCEQWKDYCTLLHNAADIEACHRLRKTFLANKNCVQQAETIKTVAKHDLESKEIHVSVMEDTAKVYGERCEDLEKLGARMCVAQERISGVKRQRRVDPSLLADSDQPLMIEGGETSFFYGLQEQFNQSMVGLNELVKSNTDALDQSRDLVLKACARAKAIEAYFTGDECVSQLVIDGVDLTDDFVREFKQLKNKYGKESMTDFFSRCVCLY